LRQLNQFLPLVILAFSFAAAFADAGDLTVISGKEFKIHYETQGVQVLSVQPIKDDLGLVFSIQANTPVSTIELTLPRELIDSTEINGKDIDYIVLLDGTFASYISKGATSTNRTILIQLAPENKELEIIGTHLAIGSSTQITNNQGGQPTSTVTPSIGSQEQKPEETRQAPAQNTFNATQQPPQTAGNAAKTQKQPLEKIISLLQLSENSPLHLTKKQLVEYSVISAIVLIIILVIASSAKYKTRQQIHK
jgi:hypothetical protein